MEVFEERQQDNMYKFEDKLFKLLDEKEKKITANVLHVTKEHITSSKNDIKSWSTKQIDDKLKESEKKITAATDLKIQKTNDGFLVPEIIGPSCTYATFQNFVKYSVKYN